MNRTRQPPPLFVPTAQANAALAKAAERGRAVEHYGDSRMVEARRLDQLQRQGVLGQDAGPANIGPAPEVGHAAGGDMVAQLLHPDAFTVFEREFRVLPQEQMFSPFVNPDRPFQFTLGSFRVPHGMNLWLSDYHFGVFVFDGVNPGDFREAEEGRFSGVMGYDLTVNQRRQADIEYQLEPVPVRLDQPQFASVSLSGGEELGITVTNTTSSPAAAATSGLATLPVRRGIQGPNGAHNRSPWTWVCGESDNVALRCVIWRPLSTPIAGIFGRIAGHKLHTQLASSLIHRMRVR